jgi:hypothetical protein
METVHAVNTLAIKADTLEFDMVVPVGEAVPRSGNEVVWLVNGIREFAGRLLVVREVQEEPGLLYRYKCRVRDYSWEFDKRLVTEVYPAPPALVASADSMVTAIVEGYTSGFTTDHVMPSYPLATQTFNDIYPSDAIKGIADALEWIFYIDYDRDVHFLPLEANVSPLPGNTLDVDNDTTNYRNLEIEEDVSQVKTRLYLHDVRIRNQYALTQNFTGDGSTSWFSLGYEPYSLDGAQVTVGGTPYPVVWEGTGGKPGDGQTNAQAYYCADNMGVRITPTPPAGAEVAATHYPVDTIPKLMWDNPDAIAEMAAREGGDGVHEFALQDPNVNGPDESTAQARALLMLYKYGWARLSGSFGSDLQGWRAGQSFWLTSQYRMGGALATPVRMYVIQVEKQILTAGPLGDQLRYTVTFANTPYSW